MMCYVLYVCMNIPSCEHLTLKTCEFLRQYCGPECTTKISFAGLGRSLQVAAGRRAFDWLVLGFNGGVSKDRIHAHIIYDVKSALEAFSFCRINKARTATFTWPSSGPTGPNRVIRRNNTFSGPSKSKCYMKKQAVRPTGATNQHLAASYNAITAV
jgi:hypothetical protein